ncbi:MAG: FtsX-like permease family protein [Prevotella sp.]|jgi:putative ABC transport system permease protein|nr:FtsX-like permease family protein [Prevotella sp.]
MKSYFKFLSRNKAYTFINIAGLVVSLMFIILMGDYAWRQYSIDSWHKNADRIYLTGSGEDFFMWPQAAQEINAMCPEIEQTCCVMSQNGRIKYGQREVKEGDKENGIIMLADSTFFRFFDFELTKGDKRTALDAPDKCVITERLAQRLFGEKDPIGESLQIVGKRSVFMNHEDPYDSTLVYTVSGIVKDFDRTVLPNETQLIASMERFPQVMGYTLRTHSFAYSSTGACKAFLMLRPGATLDAKKKVIEDHLAKNYMWAHMDNQEFFATPLTDIMFAPQNNGYGMQKGDKTRLHILLAAVLAILFFAVSNYINLTVANTGFRAKEMATRRLFGSSQRQISLKLIAESTLMIAVAFLIGFALALCFQDDAAELFKGKIVLLNDISFGTVSVCLSFILLVGVISGIMPSWQISRFQPIDIVKGNFRYHSKMVMGRLFIIVQNVVTVTMLTAALVIWLQLNHLIHAPLGFNTERLYYVNTPEGKSQTVRSLLEKMPFVERIGEYSGTTFVTYSSSIRSITNGDKLTSLFLTDLDSTAFSLYGLDILEDYGNTSNGYYLNEDAKRRLELKDGDREMVWGKDETAPISGILKDFHRINVLHEAEPFAIRLLEHVDYPNFLVKTNGDKQAKAAFVEMMRGLDVPEEAMEWSVSSLEEGIAETFEDQQNTLKIITLFTIIAVIISVMGYVGMSLFFIRQRQKEIGIRKIMGSTSGEVMVLMLRIFCSPLLLSFVIAVPLSWYIMRDWLTNFSYRITLSPWIFAATCAFALLVAILSVGLQIIKAVRTNPVDSIKTE